MFAAFQVYESTQNCISGVTAVYPRTINSFAKLLGTVRGTYDYSYLGGLKVVEPKHTGRSVVTRRPSHFNVGGDHMHQMQVGTASPRELRRTTIFHLHLTVFHNYVLVLSTLPLSWTLGYMLF